jgi:hypothetical protein
MTLLELQKRINEVVAENERRGWAERNNNQVIVEVARPGKRRRRYFPIEYVSGAQLGLSRAFSAPGDYAPIVVNEEREIKLLPKPKEL